MALAGTPETRYQELLVELHEEFPRFRLMRKDTSGFQRLIGLALRAVTLGAQNRYLTHYQTTLGQTVYVTADWDEYPAEQRYVTLRHERVHLRQFRRFTPPGMALLYLFVPLPFGLAWCRARFEKEGYAETIRASAEVYGPAYVRRPELREHVISQFTSGAYGWMWPFRHHLEDWYDAVASEATTPHLA